MEISVIKRVGLGGVKEELGKGLFGENCLWEGVSGEALKESFWEPDIIYIMQLSLQPITIWLSWEISSMREKLPSFSRNKGKERNKTNEIVVMLGLYFESLTARRIHRCFPWTAYGFPRAAITKYHTLGGFNHRNLIFHSSGGWNPWSRCQHAWFPLRPLSLAWRQPTSWCVLMWSLLCVCLCPNTLL